MVTKMGKKELLSLHADCQQCRDVIDISNLSPFTVAKMHERSTSKEEIDDKGQ